MSEKVEEKITEEELKIIVDTKVKKSAALQVAERAALEAKNADLVHQVAVQHIFLKYGLSFHDNVNDETGIITRAGFVKTGDATESEDTPAEESTEA